jgi:MFS family permease
MAARIIGAMRRLFIDGRSLRRHRDFRLLFAGQGISFLGGMLTYVAIPYQVYLLSHSSLAVGLLGLAEVGPLLVAPLAGGLLADAQDRRRTVQLTELGLLITSIGLVVNASLTHPQLWVMYLIAAAMACLAGLQQPSLNAMVPQLVDRDELEAAAALTGLRGNLGMIVAPAAAGLLLATIGLRATYIFDVVSFAASFVALGLMGGMPVGVAEAGRLSRLSEGFRYVRTRPELLGSYLVDVNAMFFGVPNALFPAVAARLGGPGLLGLLYASPAAGALLASLTSGWVSRVRRQGAAIAWAAAGWGGAVVVFGLVRSAAWAMVALAAAGAADMISGLFRMTLWNRTIPDELRGRLAGIEMISYASGPALGNVESGVVANLAGVQASVVSGGLACIAGTAALAWALPAFRHFDAGPTPR